MTPECWAIALAAGRGERLSAAANGTAKQFLRWRGAPLWWASATALAASPRVRGLIVAFPPADLADAGRDMAERDQGRLGVPWKAVAGGARRQDSVRLALEALPPSCRTVLIHDCARPFASTALATRLADELAGSPDIAGVIPALPVTDTIKEVTDGRIVATPDRARLWAAQTPQAFWLAPLAEAHARAQAEGWDVTDDAALLERCGLPVRVLEGEPGNVKITRPEDLALLHTAAAEPCSGWGYDVHRCDGDRPLVLGGVPIPCDVRVAAHSDGDVLLHALMDAILGCMGGGDIGRLFPDSDPRFDGISSALLLDDVAERAARAGLRLTSVDLTLVAQKPRLAPHAAAIRRNVARLLGLEEWRVNIKATTEEGLGFTGEGRGMKAVALVAGLRERLPVGAEGPESGGK